MNNNKIVKDDQKILVLGYTNNKLGEQLIVSRVTDRNSLEKISTTTGEQAGILYRLLSGESETEVNPDGLEK